MPPIFSRGTGPQGEKGAAAAADTFHGGHHSSGTFFRAQSESGQSGHMGHSTRGKQVGWELALLQAARGCQSPLWAVMASHSHWYNYLTLGCMC